MFLARDGSSTTDLHSSLRKPVPYRAMMRLHGFAAIGTFLREIRTGRPNLLTFATFLLTAGSKADPNAD
jgi:hypothetical protein